MGVMDVMKGKLGLAETQASGSAPGLVPLSFFVVFVITVSFYIMPFFLDATRRFLGIPEEQRVTASASPMLSMILNILQSPWLLFTIMIAPMVFSFGKDAANGSK